MIVSSLYELCFWLAILIKSSAVEIQFESWTIVGFLIPTHLLKWPNFYHLWVIVNQIWCRVKMLTSRTENPMPKHAPFSLKHFTIIKVVPQNENVKWLLMKLSNCKIKLNNQKNPLNFHLWVLCMNLHIRGFAETYENLTVFTGSPAQCYYNFSFSSPTTFDNKTKTGISYFWQV